MGSDEIATPTYAVGMAAIAHGKNVAITRETYEKALSAKVGLLELTVVEETFDLVVRNFELLCLESTRIPLEFRLYSHHDRSSFMNWRRDFNRLMGNLLSSCRAFLDIANRVLSDLFGDNSNERLVFEKSTNEHYDTSVSYRLMEQIRNFHQHYSLGISSLSLGSTIAF